MRKEERYRSVIAWFERTMPEAQTELHYGSPFQLLVAVVLSAQCTDRRVNMVTPGLFVRYPDARSMSQGSPEEIFTLISSISYPRSKSEHLAGLSRLLVERWNGEVPRTVEELQQLPGVGRKTANVVTAVLYNQPNMPVDTHVFRVSNRLGLTTGSKTPLETERQLTRHIPPELIPKAHHWLILFGRYVCTARSPKCESCGLAEVCRENERKKKDKKLK